MFDAFGKIYCQECTSKMEPTTAGKSLVVFACPNCGYRASIALNTTKPQSMIQANRNQA
jgi:predicted RNA-binding Zn-ribbon protein involved in translation (DUF1610 family)